MSVPHGYRAMVEASTGDPWVVAHRGASHAYPENTRAAFDAALAEGAHGIELDLQLSADGVPVVFHDDRLDKLGLPRARICDFSLADLQTMDVGRWFGAAPARMPTLDEVLDTYAAKTRLYLELKKSERSRARQVQLAQAVARRVAARAGTSEIYILSFSARLLSGVLAAHPQARCVRSADNRWSLPLIRPQLPKLAGVCINIDAFVAHKSSRIMVLNKPLLAYTCNLPEQLQHARNLGIRHIISDYPRRSIEWLHANP